MTDKTREHSIPKAENCELIKCQSCDNETAVLQKENIVTYTCSLCYSVPKL